MADTTPVVFVLYACRSERPWLDRVRRQLDEYAARAGLPWVLRVVEPGVSVSEVTVSAFARASAIILLVSPDFVAHEYVQSEDFGDDLDFAAERGAQIVWIPIRSAATSGWLSRDRALHEPSRPLAQLGEAECSRALEQIGAALLRRVAEAGRRSEDPTSRVAVVRRRGATRGPRRLRWIGVATLGAGLVVLASRGGEEACPAGMAFVGGAGAEAAEGDAAADFCLQRTEVSVAEYQACVVAGRCAPATWSRDWYGFEVRDDPACNANAGDRHDHPVDCVAWDQADAYCRWRGGRLPTAAELNWAGHGGDARRWFPWGEDPPDCSRAVLDRGCGRGTTWPTGAMPAGASPQGVLDLVGNVWEWTATSVDATHMVMHGGSYQGRSAEFLWFSYGSPTDSWGAGIGFRCAGAPGLAAE